MMLLYLSTALLVFSILLYEESEELHGSVRVTVVLVCLMGTISLYWPLLLLPMFAKEEV